MLFAQTNHRSGKVQKLRIFLRQAPVKPRRLVVLAVCVVVAVLRSAEFVSAQEHRRSLRDHQNGDEVFELAHAQVFYLCVCAFAFKAVVVGIVVVASVAVLFAVFVVVLSVVADNVVHREAVVASNIVYRVAGLLSVVQVQVAGTGDARGRRRRSVFVSANKAAHVVPKAVVPFRPAASGKVSHLVAAARVPRLGDDFCVCQNRVNRYPVGQRRESVYLPPLVAAQNRGKVKPKAVDVHLLHPVAQAVDDKIHCVGLVAVEGVSAARIVHVILLVRRQNVVLVVLYSLEFKSIAALVSFAGVVVDNVQNNFDSGLVQFLDHLLEFADWAAGASVRRVSVLWREKSYRAVAPIIGKAVAAARICVSVFVFVKFLDWQQFHRRDSQIL